jgi:hypothetical protein
LPLQFFCQPGLDLLRSTTPLSRLVSIRLCPDPVIWWSMGSAQPLHVWIDHVFDHLVSDPPWYFAIDAMATSIGTEEWPETPETVVAHIAETFEHSGKLLSRFSDEQLNQGFWYLFYQGPPDFMGTLLDEGVTLACRLKALRSFPPLFEQVMAERCSSHLSHLGEKGANPLNSACYMWFDEVLDRFNPERLIQAQLETYLIGTLRVILAIPHDACRESALHGVGHWVRHYPGLADMADQLLSATPGLRPELIAYAESARAGNVQ